MNRRTNHRVLRTALLILILILFLSAVPGVAGEGRHGDHERARELVRAGVILPLERILAGDSRLGAGRLLEVDLERHKGVWIYEIEVMDGSGQVTEYEFDAGTGRLLREKKEN